MDENTSYFDHISTDVPAGPIGSEIDSGTQASRDKVRREPRKEPGGSGKGLFFGGMILGLAGSLLIFAIAYIAFGMQASIQQMTGQTVQAELKEGSAITSELIAKLQGLEDTIDKYYYLGEVTNEELQTGIYRGIMEALGDPYSEYYSAEELQALMEQTEGVYYGIGAYIGLDTETSLPKISGVIAGAPAEAADLRANDLIYEVDGESTYGLTLTEVVAMIKGPEATDVVLTIVREGETDYMDFTVPRKKVETPTVSLEMMEDGMAYIQVTEFDEVTVDQFADALATARGSGMKGMILDLRANPGGSLNSVVEMARMLLPEGMIVYTEDKNGKRQEYTCDGKREFDLPMVVLVDMNSASASEIMAGAIKDHGIGTLVGTTTFGKGIVQSIRPFKDGSAVKITISAYYTPNGNNIHGIGIEPDVVVEFDGEAYYGSEERPDNQLEKAKEVLLELMKK
ncbi:MAG: S41 family peptidase [Lachnospiraceae bacterium]|nr:S41 family peptidase [Butyrivibrio sp.]MCM1344700.1 S41 family peptidase [Muribaculaceae bacterium]MCM1412304.1 S41 family peptidase [Lachnospiraceae bacterium]